MSEWLTAKQVQNLLKVDRTTIYRMIKDGRLKGVKVGNQWRFSDEVVNSILHGGKISTQENNLDDPTPIAIEVLPLHCIQSIQDVFAEMAQVGMVTTNTEGEPLTEISNSCAFCNQILATQSGRAACIASWRKLASQTDKHPHFIKCHAGLQYARARIHVNNKFVAMLIAGQFYVDVPQDNEEKKRIEQLAKHHNINATSLLETAATLAILNERVQKQIGEWLEKSAHTFEVIGHERADLINRLQRIANISILNNG